MKECEALKILALTGSIGMGKTTTAAMFRGAGVPVYDSDMVVRKLYSGDAVIAIGEMFPDVVHKGRIDRDLLIGILLKDVTALSKLEHVIHPLVTRDRGVFLDSCRRSGAKLVILDTPLLFEKHLEGSVDLVLTVTASDFVQRERVLARVGMTEQKLAFILKKQTPDSEKRARSHYVINTSFGFDWANTEVRNLLKALST